MSLTCDFQNSGAGCCSNAVARFAHVFAFVFRGRLQNDQGVTASAAFLNLDATIRLDRFTVMVPDHVGRWVSSDDTVKDSWESGKDMLVLDLAQETGWVQPLFGFWTFSFCTDSRESVFAGESRGVPV